MAISRCPRESCNKSFFELQELKVQGSKFRLYAVQCSACGSVIAVRDFFNVSDIVTKIADKLGIKY